MTDPQAEGVVESTDGEIRQIELRRPSRRNALTREDRIVLRNALIKAEEEQGIRVVVITGHGEHFCAGGDVREFQKRRDRQEAQTYALGTAQVVFRAMRAMRKPTIARVRGVSAGAGMYLALGCDIVVAEDSAAFHPAHLNLAVVPDWGAVWLMPRLIGMARAKAVLLSGARIDAPTAADWGLIAESVPAERLDGVVAEYCERITAVPEVPIALTRIGLDRSFDLTLGEFLEWEADVIADVMTRPEHHERVDAFIARRRAGEGGS